MPKHILKCSNFLSALYLSIYYNLVFNGFLILNSTTKLEYTNTWIGLFISLTLSSLVSFILFYATSLNRIVFTFINTIIVIFTSTTIYFVCSYHINIDTTSLGLLLQANIEEVTYFISLKFISWITLSLLPVYFICRAFRREQYSIKKTFGKILATLSVLLIIIFEPNIICEQFVPFNVIKQIRHYATTPHSNGITENFSNIEFNFNPSKPEDLKVVLIIGESARADHFHINGYNRQTTPLLENIPNLISYNNVQSCANWTHIAIPCMLTRATPQNLDPTHQEASIITILRKLGFYTLWIGNQGGYFSLEESFLKIAKESHDVIIPSRFLYKGSELDESLLPYFDKALQQHKGNNFIVLHTMGSHYHYERRYNEQFREFKPICPNNLFLTDITSCKKNQIINSYDNTILYTDFFISEVISRLKDSNAVVIYISDHGESLGENDLYLHGAHKAKEQYHVPMMLWASDQFIAQHTQKFENCKRYINKNISQDYLFYSILDLINIKSNIMVPDLSIAN
jgi:glucan phosphoethanolaminetransferase (alkaline phosphatase superfamily)